MSFETTRLWRSTLAQRGENDEFKDPRERLRAAYLSFRTRGAFLAGEIARDLPDYTVHDISHLDALWHMGDLIAGPTINLTPSEAFVFGGAVLIHDLGNGLAAYPGGIGVLRSTTAWRDAIALTLRKLLGRAPSSKELANPGAQAEDEATSHALRRMHAQQAERLALTSWKDPDTGEDYYLIEDSSLRQSFGRIIGLIAHSHWWPIERLSPEFNSLLGAPANYPIDWTVDALKLAALLRVSDAAHLDGTRAPALLKAARKPSETSREYWLFQQKLQQPTLQGDRLLYTSGQAFTPNEAAAWWLCFDALQLLDRELTGVDSLLADSKRLQFAARAVLGAESADRLCKWIQTDAWLPVDTKIKVTDVASLAGKLGGTQLYGTNTLVPLRELIQNAADAIRARRFQEKLPVTFGVISVRIGNDSEGHWIEISDNGIGMSPTVMAGPMLDFGTSFWGSSMMLSELPGLAASGFEPVGKYGIGFFSVFMWGSHVRVTSRCYKDAQRDTHVLEFSKGLISRPILRKASESDFLRDGGTVVRIWLESDPESYGGLLQPSGSHEISSLERICEVTCPALDADLYVQSRDSMQKQAVAAFDWKTIDPQKLIYRVFDDRDFRRSAHTTGLKLEEIIKAISHNVRPIYDANNEMIGRAAIAPPTYRSYTPTLGIVTVGGLRSSELSGIAGILSGVSETAARDEALPSVGLDSLAAWAMGQAELLSEGNWEPAFLADCASVIAAVGGDTGNLPIARSSRGWLSIREIRNRASIPSEVLLVQDDALSVAEDKYGPIKLSPNVFAVDVGRRSILWSRFARTSREWPPEPFPERWGFHDRTLQGAVMNEIARSWSASPEEILAVSDETTDEQSFRRLIGTAHGKAIRLDVDILRNPNKHQMKAGGIRNRHTKARRTRP
jgi:hypothetical protein